MLLIILLFFEHMPLCVWLIGCTVVYTGIGEEERFNSVVLSSSRSRSFSKSFLYQLSLNNIWRLNWKKVFTPSLSGYTRGCLLRQDTLDALRCTRNVVFTSMKVKILIWRNWVLAEDKVTTLLERGGRIFSACQL